MLIGSRQLVEQCCFAAVLVADKRIGERRVVGQGIAAALWVELAALAQTGMVAVVFFLRGFLLLFRQRFDFDFFRVGKPQRQLVAVERQLHRIAHRRQLDERDPRAGNHAHVQKMLPQPALAADGGDNGGLTDFQFLEFHEYRVLVWLV